MFHKKKRIGEIVKMGRESFGHTLKYQDKVYDELQGLLLKNYYDFDLIDPGSLKKSNVTSKGLQIENESYQTLILPNLKAVHALQRK